MDGPNTLIKGWDKLLDYSGFMYQVFKDFLKLKFLFSGIKYMLYVVWFLEFYKLLMF